MPKLYLLSGAVLGGLGVMIGAFGAHALRPMLEAANRLDTFETAVKYQFYHALALLAIGLLLQRSNQAMFAYAGNLTLAGVLIFSGSLYILCLTGIRWLGAITPIGGLLMIAGWILMIIGIARTVE
jgi:uncharacterized membrane protein YgdD (TMEM256/DUF423 family)